MSDIYVNIEAGYYSPKFDELRKPTKPTIPQWRPQQTKAEHLADIDAYETALARYEGLRQTYAIEMLRRDKITSERHAEFERDLLDNFGITDHPKADRLFALAWQRGHSSGYGEVLSEAEDLVDLIRD